MIRRVAAGAKCPSESAIQVSTRPGIDICFLGFSMRRNPFMVIESGIGLVEWGSVPTRALEFIRVITGVSYVRTHVYDCSSTLVLETFVPVICLQ